MTGHLHVCVQLNHNMEIELIMLIDSFTNFQIDKKDMQAIQEMAMLEWL